MSQHVSRRVFLRGAAGVAVGLPTLMSLRRPAQAATGSVPMRFVVFFTPNGSVQESWLAAKHPTNFALGTILEPLGSYRSRLNVIHGLDLDAASASEGVSCGDAHAWGAAGILTGRPLIKTSNGGCSYGQGASVDQVIASAIWQRPNERGTPFRSLELGVQVYLGDVHGFVSYAGANQPLPSTNDPRAVFDRLFGAAPVGSTAPLADPAAVLRQRRRRSVLDTVLRDIAAIGQRVDAADRARLDQHLTGVRELERRLDLFDAPPAAACTRPAAPLQVAYMEPSYFPQVLDMQTTLLAHALACDLTRVCTIMVGAGTLNHAYAWLSVDGKPISTGAHQLSHDEDRDPEALKRTTAIEAWHASQLAALATKLDAMPAEDGVSSVLDHTTIVWVNELGRGSSHDRGNCSHLVLGSAGGYLKTGVFTQFAGEGHNRLWVTLQNAFGISAADFGDSRFSQGGALAALRV